jgi:hypothetical protein
VKVTVAVVAAALDEAASITFCELPDATLSEAGDAVTPAGSPLTETATVPLNEFTGLTDTLTCDPFPPAWIVRAAGVAARAKSAGSVAAGAVRVVTPHDSRSEDVAIDHMTKISRNPRSRIGTRHLRIETIYAPSAGSAAPKGSELEELFSFSFGASG